MANVVGFSARDAARVARVTRRVEAMPNGLTTSAMIGAAAMVRNVQFVRVTGDGEAVEGINYYPARPQNWSVDDGAFVDLFDHDTVQLFSKSNEQSISSGIYAALQVAIVQIDDIQWPAFCVFSSVGTPVKILRILGPYITVSSIRYYPVDIQEWSSLPATPPDSGVFAWLAPYYQTAIWGGVPDVFLDDTRAYSGMDTGETLTATADFGDGDEEMTLPIYWTAFSPPAMACDDDSPVIAPGTS